MMTAAIEVKAVRKTFRVKGGLLGVDRHVVAVDDVSFTVPTGQAHWHTLIRARAIETGCFVFAPAQVGTHKGSNRKTYGHSIAVAPWGEVLADAGGDKPGFVIAEVDLGKVAEARKMVPSLTHDRSYAPPVLRNLSTLQPADLCDEFQDTDGASSLSPMRSA